MSGQALYNRTARLVIEPPGTQFTITGLKMSFKSDKTSDSLPNPSSIDVTNLTRDTRNKIDTKNTKISFFANYGVDATALIFTGNVAKITHKRSGADTVTTLEVGDGLTALTSKGGSLSFAPGTSMGTVVQKLSDLFQFQKADIKGINPNDTFNKGLSFTGLYRDLMDVITKRQGVDWSVQNEQLQILGESDFLNQNDVIVLNNKTGLIGTPFRVKTLRFDQAKNKGMKSPDRGVQLVSLLNGNLIPGRQIQVDSLFVSGNFKVRSVSHHGDTHGNDWYSEVEAIDVGSGAL